MIPDPPLLQQLPREVDARDATMVGGEYMIAFTTPLPDDATGTWTFSADARRSSAIDDGTDEGMSVTEGAFNPTYYASVTDSEPEPRRTIVDMDKCNVCHDMLALHGGQRFNTQECVMCHRPNNSDEEVRPEDEMPLGSIDFNADRWGLYLRYRR